MPVLFFATWPRVFLGVLIAIVSAAPFAPFEILNNIVSGEYPPKF